MNIDHDETRKAPAATGQRSLSMAMFFGQNFLKEKHVAETFFQHKFSSKVYLCTAQRQDEDAHPEKHIVKP